MGRRVPDPSHMGDQTSFAAGGMVADLRNGEPEPPLLNDLLSVSEMIWFNGTNETD